MAPLVKGVMGKYAVTLCGARKWLRLSGSVNTKKESPETVPVQWFRVPSDLVFYPLTSTGVSFPSPYVPPSPPRSSAHVIVAPFPTLADSTKAM